MSYEGWEMSFTKFNELYEKNMTEAPTYTKAYEITEDEHEELTGKRKYAGFNSFRNARSKKLFK